MRFYAHAHPLHHEELGHKHILDLECYTHMRRQTFLLTMNQLTEVCNFINGFQKHKKQQKMSVF